MKTEKKINLKMKQEKIYLTDHQVSLLEIALMSLTRDHVAFSYGIDNGVFREKDIHSYISTLKAFIDNNKGTGFVLHKAHDINDILLNAVDFWGEPVHNFVDQM